MNKFVEQFAKKDDLVKLKETFHPYPTDIEYATRLLDAEIIEGFIKWNALKCARWVLEYTTYYLPQAKERKSNLLEIFLKGRTRLSKVN